MTIGDDALRVVIGEYTREAGVRNLEREIADLCRKAAREVAEGKTAKIEIDTDQAREWLGPRRFPATRASAPPTPASRPAWPGRRSAATSSSSRRRHTRARAS